MTRRIVLIALAMAAMFGVTSNAPSLAATPDCSPSSHCYSVLDANGTAFYGMYGTWNRAVMSAGSPSDSNHRFVNSEMWLLQSASTPTRWVEVGMKNGFFLGAPGVGNRVFGEWCNNNSCDFHSFGAITMDDTVTDEFQISRASSTYSWRVYFDGVPWTTTTGTGFWSSTLQEMGGEVASAYATSDLFTMYGKGITQSGARANFGTDVPAPNNDTAAGSGPADLYGLRPGESEWKWRVPE